MLRLSVYAIAGLLLWCRCGSTSDSQSQTQERHKAADAATDSPPPARRLQFESMFDNGGSPVGPVGRQKGGPGAKGRRGKSPLQLKAQSLRRQVAEILAEADLYHQWWTGPEADRTGVFAPASWSEQHDPSAGSAVFSYT